ncbi:MAG: DUF2855 family protein [Gammaproteobacteria bacterium]|jgi:hypothetical protein|nr:DUF2855 family protein [Gammaproteobacteria bacterium]
MTGYSLEVIKDNLDTTRFTELADESAPGSGDAVIRVDRFALTANNITYAVAGDMIGYWQFFPATGDWGRIPVWGKGTVVNAGDTDLTVGDEYYGYYPMSSSLVIKPEKVSPRGFVDAAAHRAALPPAYNQYTLMSAENGFDRRYDNYRMVYYPLFVTGFALDDYLFDNDSFGAERVILSSASSKTSISLASLQKKRGSKLTGLTSSGNAGFVSSLGLYDEVVTYDDLANLDAGQKVAYVDMAGNRDVLSRLHHHFNDNIVCSCSVGITHRENRDGEDPSTLPGATPTGFFAPTQIQKRSQEWGPEKFQTELASAWDGFLAKVDDWITINESSGREALLAAYKTVLNGAPPDQGYVVSID